MKTTKYIMAYCLVEKKSTAHKVYWTTELQGLRVRHYAKFLCGKCQWETIQAYHKHYGY